MNVQHYQAYLQQALDKYQDDFIIIASTLRTDGPPIPPNKIESLRVTTGLILSYIALQLLSAGGDAILDLHLKSLLFQAEEEVMESVQEAGHCHTLPGHEHRIAIHHESCSIAL